MDNYNNTSKDGLRIKIIIGVIVLLPISIIILGSVLVSLFDRPFWADRRTIPYSDMVYERPDSEGLFTEIDEIIQMVKGNKSFNDILSAIMELNKGYENFYTMSSLAYIKNMVDVTDEVYTAESVFFGEVTPKFQQKLEELFVACAESKHADKLESEYFGKGFFDAYKDGSIYSDAYVKLLQKEARLINEYISLVSGATVNYGGKEELVDDLLQRDLDEEEFDEVMSLYYGKYNKILGDIYVDLVKTRMKITKELGYVSYIDFAYEAYYRDYSPNNAKLFMQDVKKELVPLYKRVKQDGLYYNFEYQYSLNEDEVFDILKYAAKEMAPGIGNIFDYLEKYELYDISYSLNKAPMSFQIYIDAYDAPFVFVNPTGDAYDVIVFAHEFGHFVDAYTNYNSTYSNEDAEAASQSMAFLILNYLNKCTPQEKEYLTMMQLLNTLDLYIYQGSYNEFEERVYRLPEQDVTLENINKIYLESAEAFGMVDKDWKDFYALQWIDVEHFYQSPFYIIGYCISNDAAMQIYQKEVTAKGSGIDYYFKMLRRSPDMTYLDTVEQAGLESPFTEGRMAKVASLFEYLFYVEKAA